MSFRSTILAATAILATANAHVFMKAPVPYAVDKIDNSPITKAQYPCKSQNGFSFTSATEMKVGEKQTMQLSGSAIHGGGGCQLSIAQGNSPTADTVFKVIKTLDGCPATENASFDFTLPEGTPNGDLTFAWTWNSRLAGQPELYMNCAPIKVTGGSDDTKAFDALPNTLIANLDDTCKSVAGMNIQYPDPGSVVETAAGPSAFTGYAAPTGAGCGSGNGGGSPSGAPAASSGAPAASSAPGGAPVSSAPPVGSSAAPSNPGGVFAPGASSGAGAPQSTLTTLVTVTAAPSSPAQATSAPAAGTGAPAAPSSGSPTTGGATCSQNGAVVCNGPTQFGLCNNGNVVWQDVAAGTTCSNGVISKRSTYNRQLKGRVARPRVVPGKDFTPPDE